jgi:hypothetical protein
MNEINSLYLIPDEGQKQKIIRMNAQLPAGLTLNDEEKVSLFARDALLESSERSIL